MEESAAFPFFFDFLLLAYLVFYGTLFRWIVTKLRRVVKSRSVNAKKWMLMALLIPFTWLASSIIIHLFSFEKWHLYAWFTFLSTAQYLRFESRMLAQED